MRFLSLRVMNVSCRTYLSFVLMAVLIAGLSEAAKDEDKAQLAQTEPTPAEISKKAQIELGKSLYQGVCAECHGVDAKQGSSGDIRDADMRQVRKAIKGTENMPEYAFTDDVISALVTYLKTL